MPTPAPPQLPLHARPRLGALCALGGALLWGASVPFGKQVTDAGVGPLMAAGLLYAGAAAGLLLLRAARRARSAFPRGRDRRFLLASAAVGAAIAPILLMIGQSRTTGLATTLLLAVEPPATALIAVLAFGERVTGRVIAGALVVTAGAVLVGVRPGEAAGASVLGALAVAGAATAWALDNNLSARIAHLDTTLVAMLKGALAAPIVLGLSLLLEPDHGGALTAAHAGTLLALGLGGYGFGLALVVRALRELGAARTGALFATAPLFGATTSVLLGERPSLALAGAAALLGLGVGLIVTERRGADTPPPRARR